MQLLKQIGLATVVGLIAFSIGHFTGPSKVEVREVEKIVYRTNTDYIRDVDKKETIKPDGTKIIETTSKTKKSSQTSVDKETEKSTTTENRPSWHINLNVEPEFLSKKEQIYRIDIQRRIISEIYFGVSVSNQNTFGLSIGVGF